MRKTRGGNALQSEAASSISSGLSVVGKIIGDGALTIFGHVEGEVRASTIVIAEGAHIEGKVSAEELTIGGCVTGTIHAAPGRRRSTREPKRLAFPLEPRSENRGVHGILKTVPYVRSTFIFDVHVELARV